MMQNKKQGLSSVRDMLSTHTSLIMYSAIIACDIWSMHSIREKLCLCQTQLCLLCCCHSICYFYNLLCF